jgi:hypothetical protein
MLNNHLAPPPKTTEEFYAQCRLHDWGFEHSDDQRYWEAGRKNEARLMRLSFTNPVWAMIWNEFRSWSLYWSAGSDMPTLKDCLELYQSLGPED